MSEIAKCRCCGSDGEIEEFTNDTFAIACINHECVIGPSRKTVEEAVRAWNNLMEPGKA